MRVTGRASIDGLLGYVLVRTGSEAYESGFRKLDTCVLNPVAKTVTSFFGHPQAGLRYAVSRSARVGEE